MGIRGPRLPALAPSTAELVRFSGVTKTYGNGFVALAPIDLSVAAGEIVSIVGPSGCGKTTLLRIAAGLSLPTTGELTIAAQDSSYVFQEPTLMAWRTVLANTELVSRIRKVPRAECRRRAVDALRLVGLEPAQRLLPRKLSGGMKMRVSLARALASEPDLMLMDEPFAALDEITRDHMCDELIRLWRTRRFAGVFVTHSIRDAVKVGHKLVIMASGPGRIVETLVSPTPPSRDPSLARDAAALEKTITYVGGRLAAA